MEYIPKILEYYTWMQYDYAKLRRKRK